MVHLYRQATNLDGILGNPPLGPRPVDIDFAARKMASDDIQMLRDVLLPLSDGVRYRVSRGVGPVCIGIVGGPGAGKTTVAESICAAAATGASAISARRLSLEDFYFDEQTRLARGVSWRAEPGSHDLERLHEVLIALTKPHAKFEPLNIPRFNMNSGFHDPEVVWVERPDLVVIEGWLLACNLVDYGFIREYLDLLIYLDLPLDQLRQKRLERENRIRLASNGRLGMSQSKTEDFWSSVLRPGVVNLVEPAKTSCDVIIEFNSTHGITSLQVAEPGA